MTNAGVDEKGVVASFWHTYRVGAYITRELANDASLIAFELGAGFAAIVGLGVYEGTLVSRQGMDGGAIKMSQPLRYALWTALPCAAGHILPSGAVLRNLMKVPATTTPSLISSISESAAAGPGMLKVRNLQAGRHVVGLATLIGTTLQVGASIQRGRQFYRAQVLDGREPPLAPPDAVRISHRPPASAGDAPAFHVVLMADAQDKLPWWGEGGRVSRAMPHRWWTRAQWITDPREWMGLLPSPNIASLRYTDMRPLFLEAEVSASSRPRGLSLNLALESLRAGGRAGSRGPRVVGGGEEGVVRVLMASGECLRSPTRRMVEESGAVDLMVDGEAAVALAALAWMEETPYASAWSALAAQRTREEEAKISARREGSSVWKGLEQLNAWAERLPVSEAVGRPWRWLAGTWETMGRRVRWLLKGGVTARDALEEYKVVVLVHDADAPRLSQRLKLKELLQAAGWDVWGPGTSASRLVGDRDALVPVLVYCQDDATTLERARFLVRAGRPPQLTCALVEDPESACPWLAGGRPIVDDRGSDTEAKPTILSVSDVHDKIFAFIRGRVKEGKSIAEVQSELDDSTGLMPSSTRRE